MRMEGAASFDVENRRGELLSFDSYCSFVFMFDTTFRAQNVEMIARLQECELAAFDLDYWTS